MVTGAPPIPRIELAVVPTPLLKLERLSQELGIELWVKRDDLTGLLETGNKIRKLEFLVGEAFARSADTLITCGTLQSNCCRTVAAVAARLGMKAILALKGAPPEEYDGNLLLDRLLGAEARFCSDDEWGRIHELLEDLAARVRSRGAPRCAPRRWRRSCGSRGSRGSCSIPSTPPRPSRRSSTGSAAIRASSARASASSTRAAFSVSSRTGVH